MENKKVYMGSGPDSKEGFLNADIRDLPNVDIVCKAWELSNHIQEVEHIYSRYMLEHLTNFEADRALRDWLKALKTDGRIEILVPDMDFHARQWLEAEWNEDTLKDKWSDAKHSFAGFWGWQEECDPWGEVYHNSYWSVHKSGYNKKRMKFLLERIGYTDVVVRTAKKWHLVAEARKPLGGGERQDATKLEEIRLDHRKRYEFASQYITKKDAIVTDGACGVAYGSYILSQSTNVKKVQAIDISQEAINHGKEYFSNDKTEYFLSNLEENDIPTQSPDYFISFETIEHLPNPEKYIEKISNNVKEDGIFIGSTPNEDIMPYTKYFTYHTKHFTVEELENILKKYGFRDIEFFQQKRDEPSEIEKINDGQYIIFVAKKIVKKHNILIYVYSEKRVSEYISFCKILEKSFNLFILTKFDLSSYETKDLNFTHIDLKNIYKEKQIPFIYRFSQKYFNFFSKFKRNNFGQKFFELINEKYYLYNANIMSDLINRYEIDLYITTFDNTFCLDELGFIYGCKMDNIFIYLASVINYHPDGNYNMIKNNQNYLKNKHSSVYEINIFNRYSNLTYKNVHFYQAYVYKILEKYNMVPKVTWMQGGGFSNLVAIQNQHNLNFSKYFNIEENKLKILPDLSMNNLYNSFKNRVKIKIDILNKYNLKDENIMLIGLANWYELGFCDFKTQKYIIDYTLKATVSFQKSYSILVSLHPSMKKENYKYIENEYNVQIIDERLYEILPIVDFYLADQSSTVVWSILLEIKTLVIAAFKNFHFYDHLHSVRTAEVTDKISYQIRSLIDEKIDFSKDLKTLSKKDIFHDNIDKMYIDTLKEIIEKK